MAEFTAATVKALREATGQGMLECKKALQEVGGDIEAAKEVLRKKGLATAEGKAGRATGEGLIVIGTAEDGKAAAMVEVRCETDFCARNDVFRKMAQEVAAMALGAEAGPVTATDAMKEAVQNAFNQIGENMSYARGIKITAPRVGTYVHHNGKVGVLVGVDGQIEDETLSGLCMHIAFANPMGIARDDIPTEVVERETRIAKHQAIESGKPEQIAEKIVTGKVNKFLAAHSLLEQPYVRQEKKKVKDILGAAKVLTFARFAVGAEAS